MGRLTGFNAAEIEPYTNFDAIPAGRYPAIIADGEYKKTKAGDGEYLQLTFHIIGDKFGGRLLWVRLNLQNPNADAVKIASSELSGICRAVGKLTPDDPSDLFNIPLQIDVKIEKAKDGEEPRNKITAYHPAEGANHSTAKVTETIMQASENLKPAWAK